MLGKALLTAATGMMAEGEALGIEDAFNTSIYTGNGSFQSVQNGIRLGDGVEIAPGTALGGGFFAGFISATANGVATHALIVAPRATGATGFGYPLTTSLAWKTSKTTTANTTSPFDGAANTAAMIAAGAAAHPAAQFCDNLTIGGFSDWYLPARYELDIAYFNLKPTTQRNTTSWGINDYSVPRRTVNYIAGTPALTPSAAFQNGGDEAFAVVTHWSSTEDSAASAWVLLFNTGLQLNNSNKDSGAPVRAFRKIPINDPALDPYRVTGEGGLVWFKSRSNDQNHFLVDSLRGPAETLNTNTFTSQEDRDTLRFTSDGFAITQNTWVNNNAYTYASWTFRKAPKFFDVVTYTGNDVSARAIAHSLGSTPGCVIIKKTNSSQNWFVYHRSLSPSATTTLYLNATNASLPNSTDFGSTDPTSSSFYVGNSLNQTGANYVAYVFAHDAGGFGDDGNQNVISCGSCSGGVEVNLGWEPQWVLVKSPSLNGPWRIYDSSRMENLANYENKSCLRANDNSTESSDGQMQFTATGFKFEANSIYIAIRRGPMKTPTDATKVFSASLYSADNTNNRLIRTGILTDAVFVKQRNSSAQATVVGDRLRGQPYLVTSTDAAEVNSATAFDKQLVSSVEYGSAFSSMDGFWVGSDSTARLNSGFETNQHIAWAFRRAPGFFDVVAYTGNNTSQSISHNLGKAPDLLIVKSRDLTSFRLWAVYSSIFSNTDALYLNLPIAKDVGINYWNVTTPSASSFTVGSSTVTNGASEKYIAYLFATLPGVSKVGSYTGTGATLDIDCGFTNGARFVLIKRTNDDGNWYVWDTARGIVSSNNDPYVRLNVLAAETGFSNDIEPLNSGFQLNASGSADVNINGGQYIFLAIA